MTMEIAIVSCSMPFLSWIFSKVYVSTYIEYYTFKMAFSIADDQPKIPPWEEEDGIYGIMVNTEKKIINELGDVAFYVLRKILFCHY